MFSIRRAGGLRFPHQAWVNWISDHDLLSNHIWCDKICGFKCHWRRSGNDEIQIWHLWVFHFVNSFLSAPHRCDVLVSSVESKLQRIVKSYSLCMSCFFSFYSTSSKHKNISWRFFCCCFLLISCIFHSLTLFLCANWKRAQKEVDGH